MKSLLIGAGEIGVGYDFDSPRYLTHLSLLLDICKDITVFDVDSEQLNRVQEKYAQIAVTSSFDSLQLSNFQIVCVATPTNFHYDILKDCFLQDVPLVLMEKPISYNNIELEELLKLYRNSKTFVLVNYIRRFQPKMEALKKFIRDYGQTPLAIQGCYYKGLVHTASHLLDLLEFLFTSPMNLENLQVVSHKVDYFKSDPTISFFAHSWGSKIMMQGIEDSLYPKLDLTIDFKDYRIIFQNNVSEVNVVRHKSSETTLVDHRNFGSEPKSFLKEYMKPVARKIQKFFEGEKIDSNFIEAIELNKKLNYIINGKISN